MKNIFVSTTFAPDNSRLSDVLLTCKRENIFNVELGSNHIHEKNFRKIIQKYKFNFLVHNYFPIPKKNFVVNIASQNEKIRNLSVKHAKNAINFCKKTKSKLYTIHPGFLSDPVKANYKKKNYDFIWTNPKLKANYELAFNTMIFSLKELVSFARDKKVKLAIETEGSYRKKNLLLMQKPEEYQKLFNFFSPRDLGINLNIGHLNLASSAFHFSKSKFIFMIRDYIVALELSHNNGREDQHLPLQKGMWYWKVIKDYKFSKVYKILEFRNTSIKKIKNIFRLLKR